jgi:hypothetical protein
MVFVCHVQLPAGQEPAFRDGVMGVPHSDPVRLLSMQPAVARYCTTIGNWHERTAEQAAVHTPFDGGVLNETVNPIVPQVPPAEPVRVPPTEAAQCVHWGDAEVQPKALVTATKVAAIMKRLHIRSSVSFGLNGIDRGKEPVFAAVFNLAPGTEMRCDLLVSVLPELLNLIGSFRKPRPFGGGNHIGNRPAGMCIVPHQDLSVILRERTRRHVDEKPLMIQLAFPNAIVSL